MLPDSPLQPGLLVLDPSRHRQLGPQGSFVLWRHRRGRDEGLLGTTTSVLEPGGDHDVTLACVVIDALVVAVSVRDARILFPSGANDGAAPALEGPQTEAIVDLACGRVSIHAPEYNDIARWLTSELDGELLGHLYEAALADAGHRADRGRPAQELPDALDLERVPYGVVFPNARTDGYRIGERAFASLDIYEGVAAPGPARVHVSFVDDRLECIGTVTVDLSDLTLVREPEHAAVFTPEAGPSERLESLWRRYCERHRVRPRLVERRGRLIAAMAARPLDSGEAGSKMAGIP